MYEKQGKKLWSLMRSEKIQIEQLSRFVTSCLKASFSVLSFSTAGNLATILCLLLEIKNCF